MYTHLRLSARHGQIAVIGFRAPKTPSTCMDFDKNYPLSSLLRRHYLLVRLLLSISLVSASPSLSVSRPLSVSHLPIHNLCSFSRTLSLGLLRSGVILTAQVTVSSLPHYGVRTPNLNNRAAHAPHDTGSTEGTMASLLDVTGGRFSTNCCPRLRASRRPDRRLAKNDRKAIVPLSGDVSFALPSRLPVSSSPPTRSTSSFSTSCRRPPISSLFSSRGRADSQSSRSVAALSGRPPLASSSSSSPSLKPSFLSFPGVSSLRAPLPSPSDDDAQHPLRSAWVWSSSLLIRGVRKPLGTSQGGRRSVSTTLLLCSNRLVQRSVFPRRTRQRGLAKWIDRGSLFSMECHTHLSCLNQRKALRVVDHDDASCPGVPVPSTWTRRRRLRPSLVSLSFLQSRNFSTKTVFLDPARLKSHRDERSNTEREGKEAEDGREAEEESYARRSFASHEESKDGGERVPPGVVEDVFEVEFQKNCSVSCPLIDPHGFAASSVVAIFSCRFSLHHFLSRSRLLPLPLLFFSVALQQ